MTHKICPICETPNHRNAAVCITCGATLSNVSIISEDEQTAVEKTHAGVYNYVYGETDLSEGSVRWRGGTYILGGVLALSTLVCAAGVFLMGLSLYQRASAPSVPPESVTAATAINPVVTNTPRPTLFLATVTPAPPTLTATPTPTPSPTEGPCLQQVQAGDDLYGIVYRCGHRNYETIIGIVVELNKLADASRIQQGQIIEVPWPTPTPDPNAALTPAATEQTARTGDTTASDSSGLEDTSRPVSLLTRPTETLQPGVTWHEVRQDENIIVIAYNYGANLKILSELNPEITFSQCDFGSNTGGPNCIVQLYIGQRVRVPAPTPTPTLSPTISGSETPTPSATPTFNAPSPLSPSDRAFFRNNELVTLRWVTAGSLGAGQAYLVRLEDLTAKMIYTATTRELYFIVPESWHNQASARHDFIWTVSVVDNDNPDKAYYTTTPRLFTWQGAEAGT